MMFKLIGFYACLLTCNLFFVFSNMIDVQTWCILDFTSEYVCWRNVTGLENICEFYENTEYVLKQFQVSKVDELRQQYSYVKVSVVV